jgi:hypothetical protein
MDLCEKFGIQFFCGFLKFSVSTPENICVLFQSAVHHNNQEMINWSMRIIEKFTERVIVTSNWRELSPEAISFVFPITKYSN